MIDAMRPTLIAFALLGLALPRSHPPAHSLKLDVGGLADDVVTEDVDGDGSPDLIVQSGRDLRVFTFKNGTFNVQPDSILSLGPTAFLWCFAKYADHPTRLVTVMGSRGIARHAAATTGFEAVAQDLIVHPNLFDGNRGDNKTPAHVVFMRDLDGDGLDDAMLYDKAQMLIFPQRKEGFRLRQRIAIPIETVLLLGWAAQMRTVESTAVPMLAIGDINGDKRVDIAYYRNEAVGVFYQAEDGTFTPADPKDLAAKKQKPRNTFLKFEVPPTIKDLNGDGIADIAVSYPSKGKVHLFYNRSGRTDFTTPDEILETAKSWTTGIVVADLDGDGTPEIVMGVVHQLDISSGLEVFTTRKVPLELKVFRQRGKGLFTNEPVTMLTFSVPYTFQATRDNVQIDMTFRPNFDCDLDGDGRRDLLVEHGAAAFSVHPGVAKDLIAADSAYDIALDPPKNVAFTKIYAADFNKDKKTDLIVRYRTVDDQRKDEIEIKLSK